MKTFKQVTKGISYLFEINFKTVSFNFRRLSIVYMYIYIYIYFLLLFILKEHHENLKIFLRKETLLNSCFGKIVPNFWPVSDLIITEEDYISVSILFHFEDQELKIIHVVCEIQVVRKSHYRWSTYHLLMFKKINSLI